MVTYLASPAGDWITGAIMVVDGGSWLGSGEVGKLGGGEEGKLGREDVGKRRKD